MICSEKQTFLAGTDLDLLLPITKEREAEDFSKALHTLFAMIEKLKVPSIAAIQVCLKIFLNFFYTRLFFQSNNENQGSCLGTGLELILACTYRVAAKKQNLMIGIPEIKFGLTPSGGASVKLPMMIGLQEALKLLLPGANIGPVKARAMGLVDLLLDHEDRFENEHRFLHDVRKFAASCIEQHATHTVVKLPIMDRLLGNNIVGRNLIENAAMLQLDKHTRGGEFLAPYKILQSVMFGCSNPMEKALEFEAQCFASTCVSTQSKHLISVFLMQQEAKRFNGRFVSPPLPVKNVAIVNAGIVGSSIAHWVVFKNAQGNVLFLDESEQELKKGVNMISMLLAWQRKKQEKKPKLFQRLKKTRDAVLEEDPHLDKLIPTTAYGQLEQVQLIVFSCMHEKLDQAIKTLRKCEERINSNTIIAIHTNTFQINELARYMKHPDRIVGVHFSPPVWRIKLVEMIRGAETSEETLATTYKWVLSLGKIPIVVNDGPGFVLNRILGVYALEAARLLVEGAPVDTVDRALSEFGMRMGPFQLLDDVGIDMAQQLSIALEPLGKQFSKEGMLHVLHKMCDFGM